MTVIRYTLDAGWWTAQMVDHPSAISQGRTIKDARANVRSALVDLRASR